MNRPGAVTYLKSPDHTLRGENGGSRLEQIEKAERERFQGYAKEAFVDQGRGHYDLAKLFVERAATLLNDKGTLGYVLPRQALVLGGWSGLRERLVSGGRLTALQAQNTGGWLFEGVDHRIMVVLLSRAPVAEPSQAGVDIWPAVQSLSELASATRVPGLSLEIADLEAISDAKVIPWLPSKRAGGIFDRMRSRPRLAASDGWVQAKSDSRWDFSGSGTHRDLAQTDAVPGSWSVLMARHVDQFRINRDVQFRRFIPDLQRLSRLELGVGGSPQPSLMKDHPALVYRYPSRNDDARTVIAALLPSHGYLPSTGYVHGLLQAQSTDLDSLAGLLAYLNSFICDWWARRVTDRHVTAPVINNLPLPNWDREEVEAAAKIARTLTVCGGTTQIVGNVTISAEIEGGNEVLLADLERLVAIGFGLNKEDVAEMLKDFSARGCPPELRSTILDHLD